MRLTWVLFDVERDGYPNATHLRCWNCLHRFNGIPVGMPVAHSRARDEYTVTGVFCSWECAKFYSTCHGMGGGAPAAMTMLYMFKKRFQAAAPRQCLGAQATANP